MPNYTQNLNLEKPLTNENYNIDIFNSNVDKIDLAIKEISNQVNNFEAPVKSVNGKTGAVTLAATDIKTTDGKTLEQFKTDTNTQLDTFENLVGDFGGITEIYKVLSPPTGTRVTIDSVNLSLYKYLILVNTSEAQNNNGNTVVINGTTVSNKTASYFNNMTIIKKDVVYSFISGYTHNSNVATPIFPDMQVTNVSLSSTIKIEVNYARNRILLLGVK